MGERADVDIEREQQTVNGMEVGVVEEIIPPYRVARAQALAAFERHYLRRLIEATRGNASAAARTANMDRPYLLSLLRRHGLR